MTYRVFGGDGYLVQQDTSPEVSIATVSSSVICDYIVASPSSGKVNSLIFDISIVGGGVDGYGTAHLTGSFSIASSGIISRVGTDDNSTKGFNNNIFSINIATNNHIQLLVTQTSATQMRYRFQLTVTYDDNVSTITAAPTLSSLNYTQGDIAGGGQSIVATGTNLSTAFLVTIGGNSATITGNTSTTCTFTLPAHAAGTVSDVSITTAGGVTSTTSFTYWSPVQITNVDGHWDANKGVTASSNLVSAWLDQTSNALNATQSTGANKPTQTSSVFGTLPSIRCASNGTSSTFVQLASKRALTPNGFSFFWVGNTTSTRSSANSNLADQPVTSIGDHGSTPRSAAGMNNGAIGVNTDLAGWTFGSGFNDGVSRLFGVTVSTGIGSANVKAYAGGTQQGATVTTAAYDPSNSGYDTIGAGFNNADGWVGDLGAVIAIKAVISGGDLTNLYAWAQQRWGVQ